MVTTMLPQAAEVDFDWKEYAPCLDINVFFVEGSGNIYTAARRYCCNCLVVVDCLIEGLDDEFGMRGCMSPNERISVVDWMEAGYSLKTAAEAVWKYHRDRGKTAVPLKSIWEDWDA